MIKVLFLRWWFDCFEVCDAAAASGLADYPCFVGCPPGCLDPRIFAPHRSHLVSPGGYDERSLAFDRLAHGARLSLTRKVVAPIGGVDVTPVIWVGLISLFRECWWDNRGFFRKSCCVVPTQWPRAEWPKAAFLALQIWCECRR